MSIRFFASAGALAMIAASHVKGLHDVALAGVSGAVTQVPFVVLPIAMILIAVFTQTGVVPGTEHGGALPIDLETVSVLLLGFPPMLVLLIIALWLNQTRSPGRLWYTDKFLVITNLIIVFPVGLYGVAKGGLFSYGPKWYDNRAYLIFLLIYLLPPVLTSPVALYALIRTKALGITGKIIVLILFSAWLALIFLAPPETPTQ